LSQVGSIEVTGDAIARSEDREVLGFAVLIDGLRRDILPGPDILLHDPLNRANGTKQPTTEISFGREPKLSFPTELSAAPVPDLQLEETSMHAHEDIISVLMTFDHKASAALVGRYGTRYLNNHQLCPNQILRGEVDCSIAATICLATWSAVGAFVVVSLNSRPTVSMMAG
jgi:hypothetical protein